MKEYELNINDLCDKSYAYLKETIKGNYNRFCIPKSGTAFRISEQEIKCCFIETFLREAPKGYLYSVETPTIEKYRFSQGGKNVIPHKDENGRRGNIDLVIFKDDYKDENRVAIIEFKANIADDFKHAKDFCKLKEEPGEKVLRYFIELFVTKDGNEEDRLKDKLFCNEMGTIDVNTEFVCYGLNFDSIDERIALTKANFGQ